MADLADTLAQLQHQLARTPVHPSIRPAVIIHTDPVLLEPGDAYAIRREEATGDPYAMRVICHPDDAGSIASVYREWDWIASINSGPPPADVHHQAVKYRQMADMLSIPDDEWPEVPPLVAIGIAALASSVILGIIVWWAVNG